MRGKETLAAAAVADNAGISLRQPALVCGPVDTYAYGGAKTESVLFANWLGIYAY